jgi:hypothetical protein
MSQATLPVPQSLADELAKALKAGQPLVDMRTATSVRDFSGATVTHDALARGWGIKVAPTVLFFGAKGKEIAERLEGGYIPDFYGAYLEQRLQVARALTK